VKAVVEKYFSSWNISQVFVLWAFWIRSVCSKNKLILSVRSEYNVRFKHLIILIILRFKVVTAASMKFRFAFWDVLPGKIINNNNNYYYYLTRQYIPEDKSEQSLPLFTSKSPLCIITVILISPNKFALHEALFFLQTAFWIWVIPTWRSKKYLVFLYMYLYLMFITWISPWVQSLYFTCLLAANCFL
jgi:hypothetical protein